MMKKLIVALVASAFALTACSNSAVKSVENVGPTEWVQKVNAGDVKIIDVRTPEEYAAGHVVNAVNINVESGSFESEIASLDKGATYALYCRSGRRSAIAADLMSKAGFEKVINLEGGFVDILGAGAQLG